MTIPFLFNYSSLTKLIKKETQEIMIFGYGHCKYREIADALKSEESPIKKVFTEVVGKPNYNRKSITTAEGRLIAQIPLSFQFSSDSPLEMNRKKIGRECKAALVNIVMENCFRKKQGKPLIPVVFCVAAEGSEYSPSIPLFLSPEEELNQLMTHKEVRRAYKLMFDEDLPIEISMVAQETFQFTEVTTQGEEHSLEPIFGLKDDNEYRCCLDKRKKDKPQEVALFSNHWKTNLKNFFLRHIES